MTIAEILRVELDKLRADIVAHYERIGMRASGAFEEETTVTVEKKGVTTSGTITAPPHTWYMVHGRAPGKFPPRKNIIEWIRAKNLTFDIPINSLAFLIARKIAREGTRTFQAGGSDVISAVLTPERVRSILLRVQMETGRDFEYSFTSQIINTLQNGSNN